MDPAFILATLVALGPSHVDRGLSLAERQVALAPVAAALSRVAKNPHQLAELEALGEAETHFAVHVVHGRCDLMPAGERCDGGTSRSPWQLKRRACPRGWELPEGSVEALEEEARCALALLGYNARRGREHAATPLAAAFAGYGARPWSWPEASRRAARAVALEARIVRQLAASPGR